MKHLQESVFTALQSGGFLLNIHELGAVFLLDMLLGNPDRLPSKQLGWRGNLDNLFICTFGVFKGNNSANLQHTVSFSTWCKIVCIVISIEQHWHIVL